MQTFLPYADFQKSVESLDYRRLGKQRVEALQILNALRGKSKGWVNHPCTKMWRGYEDALVVYMNCCIREWIKRGYKNTMKIEDEVWMVLYPHWFGDNEFHLSHQSSLIRKDPDFYRPKFPNAPDHLPYKWPRSHLK